MFRSLLLAGAAIGALSTAALAQTPANNAPTRALDRAAGTNQSGAYPLQSDGMPGNPPGTAVGRTIDRATGTPPASDPPGTALERSFDRAAGTNQSGAFPRQSDGTPGNPPGTAVGRAIDRATGTPPGTNPPGTAASRAAERAAPPSGPPATNLPSGRGTN